MERIVIQVCVKRQWFYPIYCLHVRMGKCQHYSLNSERPLPLATAGNQSHLKSVLVVKPAVILVNEPEWCKNALSNTLELRIKLGCKHATESPANFSYTTTVRISGSYIEPCRKMPQSSFSKCRQPSLKKNGCLDPRPFPPWRFQIIPSPLPLAQAWVLPPVHWSLHLH